jgi:NAD(P)H-dependent FMN reductase
MLVRLMQSPGFTRWLASSAREVAASPNRISTTLGRLAAMQFDAPTKQAVDKYIQAAQAKIREASAPAGATP